MDKYSKMIQNKDTKGYNEVFKDALIEEVGYTEEKIYGKDSLFAGHVYKIEGGLTFILNKNGKRTKVILGYTELGEWIENVEEL